MRRSPLGSTGALFPLGKLPEVLHLQGLTPCRLCSFCRCRQLFLLPYSLPDCPASLAHPISQLTWTSNSPIPLCEGQLTAPSRLWGETRPFRQAGLFSQHHILLSCSPLPQMTDKSPPQTHTHTLQSPGTLIQQAMLLVLLIWSEEKSRSRNRNRD